MTAFFGWAFAASLLLLLILWLGPRLLLWIVNWYINRIYRMVRKFEERRQERNEQIRAGLAELERAMEARRDQP